MTAVDDWRIVCTMLISPETQPDGAPLNLVRAYTGDQVVVNNTTLTHSFILTPEHLDAGWPPADFAALQTVHLDVLLALEPEIILLGTGRTHRQPDMAMLSHVLRRGVGFEVMDTPSACRTYNILVNERRRVVAGILLN